MSPRAIGALAAVAAFAVDQGHKLWMLNVYGIEAKSPVPIAPFFDLIMAWNRGISYSLFEADTLRGRLALLAVALAATGFLGWWLWKTPSRIAAAGLGLLIGGALANALDRVVYGAVADFFYFHVGGFSWYVFNLADVAIVAGVALLLYESFFPGQKADAARPPP